MKAPALWVSLALLLSLVPACDGYRAVIRFEPADLTADIERMEVALVENCEAQPSDGSSIIGSIRQISVRRDSSYGALGQLESEGTFGLLARGTNDQCRIIAFGCANVELERGGSDDLIVIAHRVDGPACQPGEECRDLECRSGSTDGDADTDADLDADSYNDTDADTEDECLCLISGHCAMEGELNPENPCEACRPEINGSAWSPLDEGTSCVRESNPGTCGLGMFMARPYCCGGCWFSYEGITECLPGNDDMACGHGGIPCAPCMTPMQCNVEARVCEVP